MIETQNISILAARQNGRFLIPWDSLSPAPDWSKRFLLLCLWLQGIFIIPESHLIS
jgi:hypothetical protein